MTGQEKLIASPAITAAISLLILCSHSLGHLLGVETYQERKILDIWLNARNMHFLFSRKIRGRWQEKCEK
jgi:hypothetical protein